MNFRMIAAFALTLSCWIPFADGGQAQGQNQEEMMERQSEALDQQIEKMVEKWKKVRSSKFEIRIDEMKRVCELDETQIKKLKFGAKGAISQSAKKMKKRTEQMFGGMGGMGGGFAMPMQVEEVEGGVEFPEPVLLEGGGAMEMVAGDGALMTFAVGDSDFFGGPTDQNPENEEIWTKTITKVLTSDQQKQYSEAVAQREKKQQKACVIGFLARADLELMMTEEQNQKMVEYVNKKYGRDLVLHGNTQSGMFMTVMGGQQAQTQPTQVKAILSDAQYAIWTEKYQTRLDGFESSRQQLNFMRQQMNNEIENN